MRNKKTRHTKMEMPQILWMANNVQAREGNNIMRGRKRERNPLRLKQNSFLINLSFCQ